MAVAALVLYLVWAVLAFGWRAVVQRRRTGDTGFRGFSGRPASVEWWAGALFLLAIVAGFVAPVADLADLLRPIGLLDHRWLRGAGVVLGVAGVAGTLVAQMAMGASWRVGVDPTEQTTLVTGGMFALVRNPIFTMMLITATGLTAMVPNVLALSGLVGLFVAIELQVRVVEEPYLDSVHGHAYAEYAASAGRFVLLIGRLQDRNPHQASNNPNHQPGRSGHAQ